ncbi:hypothetical protein FRC07_009887 [Ceratobasidium sp. 392]|nr:hypothetical protein FRC07_009887 [Ceratobasidium sp. 392]
MSLPTSLKLATLISTLVPTATTATPEKAGSAAAARTAAPVSSVREVATPSARLALAVLLRAHASPTACASPVTTSTVAKPHLTFATLARLVIPVAKALRVARPVVPIPGRVRVEHVRLAPLVTPPTPALVLANLNARPTCPAGWYSQAGATSCSDCPEDTYSSAGASKCTQCPTGKGCGRNSYTPNQCIDKCPDGQVYTNGRCQNCPAGSYSNNNQCSDCPAGTISNPGSKSCTVCPGGSVPSSNGQSCTTCPRNTFSSGDNCSPCPAGSTSNPGSSSCGPQPSRRAQPVLSATSMCQGHGFQSCEVMSGMGGFECINTLTTIDSCGGCVGPEGEEGYTGRDCTAIPNVDKVRCSAGKCEISSCRSGFEPSGGNCVSKSGPSKNATSGHAKRGMFSRHDSF